MHGSQEVGIINNGIANDEDGKCVPIATIEQRRAKTVTVTKSALEWKKVSNRVRLEQLRAYVRAHVSSAPPGSTKAS